MSSAEGVPDHGEALEKAYSAFCDAWLGGEEPDLESFCREHPSFEKQLRERIERFMSTVQQLEQDDGSKVRDMPDLSGKASPGFDAAKGEQLGDFVLIRELGRGGMGVVYEARQVSLNRIVALKVLPAHLTLRKESVERFRREASAGAKVKHPGIVEIHAIGEDKGTHFFAMEFVEGAPLDKVIQTLQAEGGYPADGKRMGAAVTSEKFRLTNRGDQEEESVGTAGGFWNKSYIESVCRIMMQVLEALDHAHKAGVIHRDVKPSNILVRCDGSAVLTDFGLAREEGLPSLTLTGELSGTPHYIAPEQASPKGRSLDLRVDIFALGVTFYELITLQKAYDGKTSQEVLTKILARDPTLPRAITRMIPKDLETICLKAMEKDPDRRYTTAGEFLEDLTNFLEFRPIKAQPAGMVRRTCRLVRRNPALSAMFGTLFLLVVVGPLVFGIQQKLFTLEVQGALTQAEKERKAKEDALLQVEEELVLSNQVIDFLVNLFQMSDPNQALGRKITAYELLQKGATSINSEFRDQPETRVRLITIMARAFTALGDFESGERLLKDALNTCLDTLGEDHELSVPVLYQLGAVYLITARYEEAESMIKRTLTATSGRLDEEGASWNLMAMNSLASLRLKQGNFEEAETLLLDSFNRSEEVLGKKNTITIQCMECLGKLYIDRNRLDEAESLLLDCLDRCLEVCGEDDPHTAITSTALGSLYNKKGDWKKAESLLLQVSKRNRRIYGDKAPATHIVNSNLASLYIKTNRWDEAELLLKEIVNCFSEKLGYHHPFTPNSIKRLAQLYMMTDRPAEAELLARKALEKIPPDAPEYAQCRAILNEILRKTGGETSGGD